MELNVAHYSKFPQQRGGLMICGYEWGYSKQDQEADAKGIEYQPADTDVACTFANKELRYGPRALNWRYDASIMKWFEIWGHPFNKSNPSDFDKSVIQTNWCKEMNHSMDGKYSKLNDPAHSTVKCNRRVKRPSGKPRLGFGSRVSCGGGS